MLAFDATLGTGNVRSISATFGAKAVAASLLRVALMKRIVVVALVSLFTLSACATSGTQKSVTPQVQVVVKGAKKKPTNANYKVSPEESKLTGSGGSAK